MTTIKLFNNILDELKFCEQWVLWKPDSEKGKIPYSVSGQKASVSNPDTWSSYEDACAFYDKNVNMYSGIGFVFTDTDPYIGFDWDHVRDSTTGEWNLGIFDEIMSLESYGEVSQSGEGAHVIAKGSVPGSRCRKDPREMYDKSRFFAVTGNHIEGTPVTVEEAPKEAIQAIYGMIDTSSRDDTETGGITRSQVSDHDIIERCKYSTRDTGIFESLYRGNWESEGYKSQSEADMAFCNYLAYHTRDPRQIDRIFLGSGLCREKWDRLDYKEQTINKALENVRPKEASKDSPFTKYFAGKGQFIVRSLANEIMGDCHFITLDDTKEIYHYSNGVYLPEGENLILKSAQQNLGDYYKKSYVENVVEYIKIATLTSRDQINQENHIINLKNGLYNLETNQFRPHSPEKLSTIQIPVTYDPNAECPNIDKFMFEIVSEEDRQVLLEWAGYSMIPDTRMQKAVMLVGNGSNGKSVFLKMLTKFIGWENTCGESLQKLERDKFSAANLYGKLLNVSPDLASSNLSDNSTFKELVGGDNIRGEQKFQTAFYFENTARLIFSANQVPAANGDFAYFRRWILIEFPNTFEGRNADKDLLNKITGPEELSGFLNKALAALSKLLENEEFSYSKTTDDVRRMYQIRSDTVAAFDSECVQFSVEDTPKLIMYNEYVKWCESNDVDPVTNNIFGKKLKELGYKDSRESIGERRYLWEGVAVKSL